MALDCVKKRICVFGASSSNGKKEYYDDAYRLGQLMALSGYGCVCGAGKDGIMRALSDGVLDSGGFVTGVIPRFMVDNGWGYDRLSETIITEDMHARKQTMANLSDAVIALPGGCGTFEELLEAITWRQLAIFVKPIVILNTCNFYDNLLSMLDHAIAEHFMKDSHGGLWYVASSPEDAMGYLEKISFRVENPESKY